MSCANQNSDHDAGAGAIIDSSNTNQSLDNGDPPQIFKLNVDCFEHLFEWLSLKQLLAFRCSCNRMKQVVDYYIKLNYPQLVRLSICNRRRWIHFHKVRLNYFDWIKQLSLDFGPVGLTITVPEIESIAYVLNRLEVLRLNKVRFNGEFYEVILRHCPLLKHLILTTDNRIEPIIGTGNQWLYRQYPSMEHFEFHAGSRFLDPIQYTTELVKFFKLNPQIRILTINSEYLDQLHRLMLDANIKCDRLDVYMEHQLSQISNLATLLHEHGFYERLHIYAKYSHPILREEHCLPTFKNLEKLHWQTTREIDSTTPVVECIKELSVGGCNTFSFDTLKIMVENFINLRCVDMRSAYMYELRLFVCHAPKLQQIQVVEMNDHVSPSDFVVMNEKRNQLTDACKIKILIEESVFLECKWAGKLNFSLIELKRINKSKMDPALFYY